MILLPPLVGLLNLPPRPRPPGAIFVVCFLYRQPEPLSSIGRRIG